MGGMSEDRLRSAAMEQALNDVASITNTAATQYVLSPSLPLSALRPTMAERERKSSNVHPPLYHISRCSPTTNDIFPTHRPQLAESGRVVP